MARFDLTQVRINIANGQPYVIDSHCTTRTQRLNEVVSVSFGSIVIYAYDLKVTQGLAAAWRIALGFASRVVPETLSTMRGPDTDRNHAGLILRVAGTLSPNRINGVPAGASYNGIPHVRVELGRLVVHGFDAEAIRSWSQAWDEAEKLAQRLWPVPDAFDEVVAEERQRIARTGQARRTRTQRS